MFAAACRVSAHPAVKAAAVVIAIGGGLVLDQKLEFWGQALTDIVVWAVFLHYLLRAPLAEQESLVACVLYATFGEIFLSLGWGLYTYRLDNIPLFVPPGHALLFMLGALLAPHLTDRLTWAVPLASTPFVLALCVTGIDTLGAPLFAIFLLCMIFGPAKKLYATMFVLSLAMEIEGTWLGNWTWSPHVPWLGLSTINPPLAAGAFYCALDLLVTATRTARDRRRVAAPELASARAGQP